MRIFITALLGLSFAALTLAQEETPSIEEIRQNCFDYAQEDQISEEELDEYIADCVEIEADSYGIEYPPLEDN